MNNNSIQSLLQRRELIQKFYAARSQSKQRQILKQINPPLDVKALR